MRHRGRRQWEGAFVLTCGIIPYEWPDVSDKMPSPLQFVRKKHVYRVYSSKESELLYV